jgi:hypothetical protein
LANRKVKGIIGRDGFPRVDLQSPLIAVLGLLAIGAGYRIGALSQRSNVSSRAPNKSCGSHNEKNESRKD